MAGKIRIGMSGWSYSDWRGLYYPEKSKSADWLTLYADEFDTAEINSCFYRLPNPQTLINWAAKVPEDFKFAAKMSRYATHILRLKTPDEPLQRFFNIFAPVKSKLGPILVQLPPTLKFDAAVVRNYFGILQMQYGEYRFALEARHATWLERDAIKLLEEYNIAWVISQSGVGFPYSEDITSDIVYLRFHGPEKLFSSSYTDDMLRSYARKIKRWVKDGHHVWVYFNNTMGGAAIGNARTLKKMLGAGNK